MAVNDAFTVIKDTVLMVAAPGVLTNDSDANGDPLTAVLVSGVSQGSLTLNSNGSFTYTPTAGYAGSDSFTYKANDGKADSNTATVTITITQSGATFGLNSGNVSANENPSYLSAMRFQNGAGTGTLSKLEILFDDTTPNGKVRLGVYADNNGKPASRLLDAGEVTVANGWVSITGLSLPVTQNAYYWLAFDLQSSNGVTVQIYQATNSHYWNSYTYGALPSQFPLTGTNSGSNEHQWVMRATVTPGGP
ncbi:MAG: hypothetical protein A2144_12865 [Chloroflexi bacterium RBG_16_50_9]|nr:MAG: hypothetical protein A2144_12865 [Chloroflexi bacterium RBG_16_50_9]